MGMLPLPNAKSTPSNNGNVSPTNEQIKQEERADDVEDASLSVPVEFGANSGDASKLDDLLTISHLLSEFIVEKMDQVADEEDVETQAKEQCVEVKRKEHGQKRKANVVPQYNDKKAKTAVAAMLTRSHENRLADDCNLLEQERWEKEQAHLVPLMTGGKLKSYQVKGVKWLISLWMNGSNGILADEMGLGKTIQTIGFLAHLIGKGLHGPYMIIAPLSTLSKWVNKISRFTPSLASIIYYGDEVVRAEIRRKLMPDTVGPDFPIVVTSYEMAMSDARFLANYEWKYVVVDEGHQLKNSKCVLMKEIRRIPAENKLLLTRTPLQNDLAELWSLLKFIFSNMFPSHKEFETQFGTSGKRNKEQEETEEHRRVHIVSKLHAILRPFLLRRMKEDVAEMLPRQSDDPLSFVNPIKVYNPSKPGDQRQGLGSLAGHAVEPEITAKVPAEDEDAELEQHVSRGLFNTEYDSEDVSDDEHYIPPAALPRRTHDTKAGSSAQAAQTNTPTSQPQTLPFDFQQQILRLQDAQLEMMRNLQAQQQEMREQAQKDREMQAMMFQYMVGSMGHVFQHIGLATPTFSAVTPSPVSPGVAPSSAVAAPARQSTPVPQPASAFPAAQASRSQEKQPSNDLIG